MKKVRIALNGFGRIGRAAFKAATANLNATLLASQNINPNLIEIVAINDLTDTKTLAYLLKYDSVYGRLYKEISYTADSLVVGQKSFKVFAQKDPSLLPWKDLDVDVVLECTGRFTKFEDASAHLKAGAKVVIISAPGDGEGETFVLGTEKTLKNQIRGVVSNASCTTNSVAPVMEIMDKAFGVEKSLMTTAHAYTASENLVDTPSKDLRKGRAAGVNIIPTTTGAAIATTKVVEQLKGKFDGIALRVPVVCGSISDITMLLKKSVTVEEVNGAIKSAERLPLYKGVIKASEESLVSTDILGLPFSGIVDLDFTRVVGGNLVKLLVWYDNEWGYSCRLVELALKSSYT